MFLHLYSFLPEDDPEDVIALDFLYLFFFLNSSFINIFSAPATMYSTTGHRRNQSAVNAAVINGGQVTQMKNLQAFRFLERPTEEQLDLRNAAAETIDLKVDNKQGTTSLENLGVELLAINLPCKPSIADASCFLASFSLRKLDPISEHFFSTSLNPANVVFSFVHLLQYPGQAPPVFLRKRKTEDNNTGGLGSTTTVILYFRH
ncbi:hypothetical protein ACJX0J_008183 [Zea mays]